MIVHKRYNKLVSGGNGTEAYYLYCPINTRLVLHSLFFSYYVSAAPAAVIYPELDIYGYDRALIYQYFPQTLIAVSGQYYRYQLAVGVNSFTINPTSLITYTQDSLPVIMIETTAHWKLTFVGGAAGDTVSTRHYWEEFTDDINERRPT